MKKKYRRSIRTNLVYMVLLILVPLFGLGVYSAFRQKEQAIQQASENALRIAGNIAKQQKFVEENTRLLLSVISEIPDINGTDSIKINRILKKILGQNPSYAVILLVDTSGNLIASGLPGRGTINVSDRKYFRDAMRTKTFSAGEYTHGRLTRKPALHYAIPVFNRDSSIHRVLIASFDLGYYNSIFNNFGLDPNSDFIFLDQNGVMLYHYPDTGGITGIKANRLLLSKIHRGLGSETFVAVGSDGIKRLYGLQALHLGENLPYMMVYVGIPYERAISGFQSTLKKYSAFTLISAILFVVIAYLFANRSIVSPFEHLVNVAGKIAEGDLSARTGISGNASELGKLGEAIDEMTFKLSERENERKLAEKNLKKLKERFELAVNSAHIGIFDWHIRNNILVWDKNMNELYGTNIDEHTFESWKALVYPDDQERFGQEIVDAIGSFRSFKSEFRIIHPHQGLRHIRIYGNVIPDKEGRPVRLIGVNRDISEARVLERRLRDAREKAETNDRLKSTFLANVSHEIRTPLHGMIGFAQILKNDEVSIEERQQFLDIIINSGNKLMSIISNIIDISLIDAGQIKLVEHECDVKESFEELYKRFLHAKVSENKSFEFTIGEHPDLSNPVLIDIARFNQVFSNLIDNAFKFTEYGEVKIGCRYDDDALHCYVKDTGIGVEEENITRIFDRFKQLDDGNDRHFSGNGLGLSISKGLVDLMGGKIWVVNCDKGSEFCFTVPVKTPQNIPNRQSSSARENVIG